MLTGIGRTTVLVDDQRASLDWYRDVLGFEVLHDEVVDGYRYLHIGLPSQPGAGLWLMPVTERSANHVGGQTAGEPLLVLYTSDLGSVIGHLEEREIEMWNVRDDDHGRSLHLRDIAGNILVIAEVVAAGAEPPTSPSGRPSPR